MMILLHGLLWQVCRIVLILLKPIWLRLLIFISKVFLCGQLQVVLPSLPSIHVWILMTSRASLHSISPIITLLALGFFSNCVDLMRLLLAMLLSELVCLFLDLKQGIICITLVLSFLYMLVSLRGS
jgi:hypothetical protein